MDWKDIQELEIIEIEFIVEPELPNLFLRKKDWLLKRGRQNPVHSEECQKQTYVLIASMNAMSVWSKIVALFFFFALFIMQSTIWTHSSAEIGDQETPQNK